MVALHRELGLSVGAALAAATLDAAMAYGIGDTVGSIAESLRADLLLVDGLVEHDIDAVTRPLAVWSAGTLVANGGLLDVR